MPLEERFWSRVDRKGDDECWLWTGGSTKGAASFWIRDGELGFERGRRKSAYLVAFRLVHGRWPKPYGLHGCDNPMCCNPMNPEKELHVHEGTAKKNMQEMVQRGRNVTNRVTAKLTDAQVAEIRARYVPGQWPSQTFLAREYGVSQGAISFILLGKTYKGRGLAGLFAKTSPYRLDADPARTGHLGQFRLRLFPGAFFRLLAVHGAPPLGWEDGVRSRQQGQQQRQRHRRKTCTEEEDRARGERQSRCCRRGAGKEQDGDSGEEDGQRLHGCTSLGCRNR